MPGNAVDAVDEAAIRSISPVTKDSLICCSQQSAESMWLCGCNYACDGEYLVPLHPQTPIAPTHKCNGKPHQSPIFHEKIMKTAATNVKMMVSCFILHYIFFGAASFSATCILFISLLRSFISLPSVFYSNVLHLPVCLFVTFQYFALPRILPPAALSTTLSQS